MSATFEICEKEPCVAYVMVDGKRLATIVAHTQHEDESGNLVWANIDVIAPHVGESYVHPPAYEFGSRRTRGLTFKSGCRETDIHGAGIVALEFREME